MVIRAISRAFVRRSAVGWRKRFHVPAIESQSRRIIGGAREVGEVLRPGSFDRSASKRGLTNTCQSNSADGANHFDRFRPAVDRIPPARNRQTRPVLGVFFLEGLGVHVAGPFRQQVRDHVGKALFAGRVLSSAPHESEPDRHERYAVLLDQPCFDSARAHDLPDLERGRWPGQEPRKQGHQRDHDRSEAGNLNRQNSLSIRGPYSLVTAWLRPARYWSLPLE